MRFSEGKVTVTKGRVSNARCLDGGDMRFIVEEKGVLVAKTVRAGSKMAAFSGSPEVVGYCDDCFLLGRGRIERRGMSEYVPYPAV